MAFAWDEKDGLWHFETPALLGTLNPNGSRFGIKRLVHRATGTNVVHPLYDVYNLFLLFARNRCMGQARELAREVSVSGNSLSIHWPATKEHNADLTAEYRLVAPDAVDLSVTVRSHWPYPDYEVFLSNYFPPAFQPWVYVQGCPYVSPPNAPQWVAPQVNDVFAGTGLVWPRDFHCARLSVDGRWTGIWHLYQWNPQRLFEAPLMMQTSPDGRVAVALMCRPQDCYAVVSGYHSENMDDPFKSQNPLYVSLFGRDLSPGQEATAHVRLVVLSGSAPHDAALSAYRAFAHSEKGNAV